MTGNQTLALLFPLIGVCAIFVTALLVVKPWTRKQRKEHNLVAERKKHNLVAADLVVGYPELDAALLKADRLIHDVRRQLRLVVK